VTEAIKQATQSLDVQKAALAESIHHDIMNQVKRDLGIARGQVIDLPALPVMADRSQSTALPIIQSNNQKPGMSLTQLWPLLFGKKNKTQVYESNLTSANLASKPADNTPTDQPAPITPSLVDEKQYPEPLYHPDLSMRPSKEGTQAQAPAPFRGANQP